MGTVKSFLAFNLFFSGNTKTITDVPFITFEPKNLEFHPLQTGDLSNVRFKLLRTDGTKPEFAMNETVKLFMSIQFRRKK